MINKLKQKNTSLSSEATMNWGHILKEEFDFNLREQRIKQYEEVTADLVKKVFRNVFYDNVRRVNMKIFSHGHRDQVEKRKES